MVYRNFCGLNEDVSIIGYGTMGLGGAFGSFDEKEAIRSIHTSIDKGVNFFDTARHYGNSEEILGKATLEEGKEIMENCLDGIYSVVSKYDDLQKQPSVNSNLMSYETTEGIWNKLKAKSSSLLTCNLLDGQSPAPSDSIWKPFENFSF